METADERDCLQQMFWDEDSGNGRNINPLWKEGDDDPYSLVLSSLSVSLTSYSTWKCIQRGSKQIAIWNLNISVSKLFWSRKYLNRDVCGAGSNCSLKPGFQTPGPGPWFFRLLRHAWNPAWRVDFASECLLTKMPFLSNKMILQLMYDYIQLWK